MEDNTDPAATESRWRALGLGIGLILFIAMLASTPPEGMAPMAWRVAAVASLMAVLWITEALPVAATALIPLAAFPLLGVGTMSKTAAPYANPLIFLFLGGFIIALTMERWQLHTRIALAVLRRAGNRMDALIAAFMGATAFLSMWVSNTATTLMMIPIVLSVAALGRDDRAHGLSGFSAALLLSVAYGASIGGIVTLVGTPPNAFLAAFMLDRFGLRIGFAEWLMMGLPLALIMLVVVWWLLTHVLFRLGPARLSGAEDAIAAHAGAQGPMNRAQKMTAALFVCTAVLWITRPWIKGALGLPNLDDTVIAMVAALAAFCLPVDIRRGIFLMNWEHARRVPWGILLLFGGGLALAGAISRSGLADWIGARLTVIGGLAPLLVVLAIVTVIIFLTELTSNTATTATFLPVVATLALTIGENPLLLAAPAALAASCAFMLPVATPPTPSSSARGT